nr:receptor-like protein 12 [Ipomoea batatas]
MKTPLLPWLFLISLLRIICGFNISSVAAQCMSDQKMLLLQLRSSLKFDSAFSSSLPSSISNLSNLSRIDVPFCKFTGSIPSTMAQLTTLIYVDFSYNNFTGSIPHFRCSNNLNYIDLSGNGLTGSLSSKHFGGLSEIVNIDLGSNLLSGRIPPYLFSLPSLQNLVLSNNKFDGQVDEYLNNLGLGVLNLGNNQITGNIPDSFPSNCALKTLDLGRNVLEGRIPSSLINCSSLEVLNLGSNKIVDTFPCPLKNLSSLRVLVLRSNGFHGNLHCVNANHMWPNLQIIDIASNNFSGEFSSKLINWKGMIVDEDNTAQSAGNIRFEYVRLDNFYYQDKVRMFSSVIVMVIAPR